MQFNFKPGLFLITTVALLLAFGPINDTVLMASDEDTAGKILYTTTTTTTQDNNRQNTVNILSDSGESSQQIEAGQLVWGLSWSPDGTRILLNRQQDGLGQIYKLNVEAEGKTPVKLTSGDAHYYNPAWSPTGDTILYAEDDAARQSPRLMLMAADGSNQRMLYRGTAFFNAWSPDGTQVIITVEGKPYRMDITSREALPLRIQGFEDRSVLVSDWSKDGQWIAFTDIANGGVGQIYIAAIDGTNVRKAVDDQTNNQMLKWSSDGSRFVFVSSRDSEGGEVYIAQADGSDVRRLTHLNNTGRITTLAYWTPSLESDTLAGVNTGAAFDGVALRDLVDSPVDAQDPISVTQKFMSLLVDGDFGQVSDFACPEYEELYLDVAQAAHADFSDLDLTGVSFTLVNQTSTSAQVQLSGTMSAVTAGNRAQYPASLFPVSINPITLINLSYSNRWVICTPL